MKKKTQPSVYDIATGRIIALLEAGVAPWRKPWSGSSQSLAPMNYQSKRPYSGINFFLLSACYDDPYFLTFHQVREMGGKVAAGARSAPVFFWKWLYKDAAGRLVPTREESTEQIPFLRYFPVFNAADIEGINFVYPPAAALQPHERIGHCEALVASTGARIEPHSYRASYSPALDRICMPELQQFVCPQEYYATLFHELGHWTGHASRLGRFEPGDAPAAFGSAEYSREELIAEMCAAFLCARCRIDTPELTANSAAYLQGWIQALRGDSRLVVTAAAQAQKAADLIAVGQAQA